MIDSRGARMRLWVAVLILAALLFGAAQALPAQPPGPPPGPPSSSPGPAPLALTLEDAIARGLAHHVSALVAEADVRAAEGRRWLALSALLPRVDADMSALREKVSLAAFGFHGPGFPDVIGPFNVYDGRLRFSQSLVDVGAWQAAHAEADALSAARQGETDARRLVALVVTSLYLQGVTTASRVESGRAELETARTLFTLATDLKTAGLAARIDVLRAQVQLETTEQRVIALENAERKARVALAQAIGLDPVTAPVALTDGLAFVPLAAPSLDAAVARATADRADLQAADLRVASAETRVRAEKESYLPSLRVRADYGAIGNTVDSVRPTFSMSAAVVVPVFEGGRIRGRVLEADAALQRARALAGDLRSRVTADVQNVLLDLDAAERQVKVAEHTVQLATEQQAQAEDRFKAGVTNNVELVQAQAAVAAARDAYIAGLSAHNLAKAALARALGVPDTEFRRFLAGVTP